jgi:hypothetical protein
MNLSISLGHPKLIYDEFAWSHSTRVKSLLLRVDKNYVALMLAIMSPGDLYLRSLLFNVQKSAKRAVRHRSEELKLKRA